VAAHLQRFPHLAAELVTDVRPAAAAAAAFTAACTPGPGRLKTVLEIAPDQRDSLVIA
jgi:hypothetical protein